MVVTTGTFNITYVEPNGLSTIDVTYTYAVAGILGPITLIPFFIARFKVSININLVVPFCVIIDLVLLNKLIG